MCLRPYETQMSCRWRCVRFRLSSLIVDILLISPNIKNYYPSPQVNFSTCTRFLQSARRLVRPEVERETRVAAMKRLVPFSLLNRKSFITILFKNCLCCIKCLCSIDCRSSMPYIVPGSIVSAFCIIPLLSLLLSQKFRYSFKQFCTHESYFIPRSSTHISGCSSGIVYTLSNGLCSVSFKDDVPLILNINEPISTSFFLKTQRVPSHFTPKVSSSMYKWSSIFI